MIVTCIQERLLMNTFDCYPLYEVWQTVGFTVCDRVGKPLQGMWASAGLAAIFIVVLIVALILVAKYLQGVDPKYDRSAAKHAQSRVSNHLVRRTIDRLGLICWDHSVQSLPFLTFYDLETISVGERVSFEVAVKYRSGMGAFQPRK